MFFGRATNCNGAKVLPLEAQETWEHLRHLHPPDNLVIYMNAFPQAPSDNDVSMGVFSAESAKAAALAIVRYNLQAPPPVRKGAPTKAAKALARLAAEANIAIPTPAARKTGATGGKHGRPPAAAKILAAIITGTDAVRAGPKRSRPATPTGAAAASAQPTMHMRLSKCV